MKINRFAPIALFVYNRPTHTRKTVEALLKNDLSENSILYIFSDGPKDNADDITLSKIREVREYIHSVQGFKEVVIKEQITNQGLDTSVIAGVTEVLNIHGRCITIEDDIETHPWFLRFINECLDKYENDKRICMVGGYNVRMHAPWWYRQDIYLAHRCCSWGWGIWKDRWDDVDWKITGYENFLNDEKQKKKFCRGGNDMLSMLIEQMKQPVPAWDIRWDYTLMKKDGYVIRPVKSLVINNGLDGTGVHCGVIDSILAASEQPNQLEYNINLPTVLFPSYIMQRRFRHFFGEDLSIYDKLKSLISRIFRKLRKIILFK